MKVKAILFDLDGVIFDSEKVYQRFWRETAADLGYHMGPEVFLLLRSCHTPIARQIIDQAAGEAGAYDRIHPLTKKRFQDYARTNGLELKPGVREFLSQLADLPLRKAIVSSSSPEGNVQILEKHGIADAFDEFISVKTVERGKPFPDVYLYACERLGLAPSECIAIEDSPNGIRSAHTAGARAVMVPDLTGPDEELTGLCTVVDRIDKVAGLID